MIQSEAYFHAPAEELRQAMKEVRAAAGERLRQLAPQVEALAGAEPDLLAFVKAHPTLYLQPAEKGTPWDLRPTALRGLRLVLALAQGADTLGDDDLRALIEAVYEHAEYLFCFNVTADLLTRTLSASFLILSGFSLRAFSVAAQWRLIGMGRLLSILEPTPSRLEEAGFKAAVRMYRGQLGRGEFRTLEDPAHSPLLKKVIALVGEWAAQEKIGLIPEWGEYYQQVTGKPLPPAPTVHLRLEGEDAFWQALNLDHAGLEWVKAALQKGDKAGAKEAYLSYVGRLAALAGRFLEAREMQVDLAEADELAQNIFVLRAHMHVRHDYGPQMDWTTILFDDIESNVSINYHPHVTLLALAYRQTGNARYLTELVRLLRSWYESAPLPNRWQPLLQWRTLEVGNRSGQQWPFALFIAARQPTFREGFLLEMCKSYLEHARYLLAYGGGMNNWFQVETCGLGVTALLFPEFAESQRFIQVALRRLDWINRECFLPDGFQAECSTAYHSFPVRGIGILYEISRLLGLTLTPRFEQEYERMMDLYVYMAQPNLTLPWLNDCSPALLSAVESAHLAAKLFPQRADFRYVATRRKEGKPPDVASFAFPYAGYYVMRDHWGEDGVYMVFDGGYYGSNHQHEDKLSFQLHAFGRTMILDPSIYQYKQDEFEPYWRSSRGHNSVMIDGKGQNRRLLAAPEPRPDPNTIWIPTAGFDFALGSFREGYAMRTPGRLGSREADFASLDKSLQHQRTVFYVKGEYFILSDRITGSGVHHVEQIFHLAPIIAAPNADGVYTGSYAIAPNNIVRTTDAGLANVAIIPLPDPRLLPRVETGQTDPVVGWSALYKKCPSHDVTYAIDAELPLVLTDVLYPQRPGDDKLPMVTPLTVQASEGAAVTALNIRHSGHTDTFVLSHSGAQTIRWGDVEFHGRAAWLRRDDKGRLLKAMVVQAHLLRVAGQAVLVVPKEQESFVWSAGS